MSSMRFFICSLKVSLTTRTRHAGCLAGRVDAPLRCMQQFARRPAKVDSRFVRTKALDAGASRAFFNPESRWIQMRSS